MSSQRQRETVDQLHANGMPENLTKEQLHAQAYESWLVKHYGVPITLEQLMQIKGKIPRLALYVCLGRDWHDCCSVSKRSRTFRLYNEAGTFHTSFDNIEGVRISDRAPDLVRQLGLPFPPEYRVKE